MTYDEIISFINATPELTSLLYDLDLMPEQVKDENGSKRAMYACAVGYIVGKGIVKLDERLADKTPV